MTERQAVQKMVQPCLTALADLHAKAIAHGAILPHNILFTSQQSACKLAGMQLYTAIALSDCLLLCWRVQMVHVVASLTTLRPFLDFT